MSMILGGYEFPWDPDDWDIPKKDRPTAWQETFGGGVFSSWPAQIAGKEIYLQWDWMSATQFDALQTLLEQDERLVWDPGHTNLPKYEVEFLELDGKYFEVVGVNADWRRKVRAKLVIVEDMSLLGIAPRVFPPHRWIAPHIALEEDTLAMVLVDCEVSGIYWVDEKGIAGLLYDFNADSWVVIGVSDRYPVTRWAGITRYVDGRLFHFRYDAADDGFGDESYEFEGSLHVFQKGQAERRTTVWECDDDTGIPTYIYYGQAENYYHLEVQGNRVVCAANVWAVDGAAVFAYQIKISDDLGVTFSNSYWLGEEEPQVYGPIDIKISTDGIVWVVAVRTEEDDTVSIELWKSNAAATSFSKAWEEEISVSDYHSDYIEMTVSPTGQNIMFTACGSPGDDMSNHAVIGTYYSSDYGVSFACNTVTPEGDWYPHKFGIMNEDKILWFANETSEHSSENRRFAQSIDKGATFTLITPTNGIGSSYATFAQDQDRIVWCDYDPDPEAENSQRILVSEDFGLTWEEIPSEPAWDGQIGEDIPWKGD